MRWYDKHDRHDWWFMYFIWKLTSVHWMKHVCSAWLLCTQVTPAAHRGVARHRTILMTCGTGRNPCLIIRSDDLMDSHCLMMMTIMKVTIMVKFIMLKSIGLPFLFLETVVRSKFFSYAPLFICWFGFFFLPYPMPIHVLYRQSLPLPTPQQL